VNKREAKAILAEQVGRLRKQSYSELRRYQSKERFRLGPLSFGGGENVEAFEVTGESGAEYQLEIQSFWDDKPNGDLRVCVSIDDGGLRAYSPLTDSFIIAPDGSFVGE
jgi:hypothetical protein